MKNTIKILTYNIHGGKSSFFKRDVTQKIEDLVVDTQADILCLQELWHDVKTNKAQLQEKLIGTWPFFHYGENAYFPGYNIGNAILSRFDILEHKNYTLCSKSKECRGLLETKIKIQRNKYLYIYCTHLSLSARERLAELHRCIDIIKSKKIKNFILAGDFNDWEQKFSNILKVGLGCEEVGIKFNNKHFKTFPTLIPFFCLDRIYFKGPKLINVKPCIQKLGPSDHRSILAEFKF